MTEFYNWNQYAGQIASLAVSNDFIFGRI